MVLVNSPFIAKSLPFSLNTSYMIQTLKHLQHRQEDMECLNPKSVEGAGLREKNGFTQMCIGNQAHQQYSLA